jgi:hypothetical protein
MLSQGNEAGYKPFKKVPLAALLSKGPMIPRFREIDDAKERARGIGAQLLLRSMYCVDEGKCPVVENLPHYVMIYAIHGKHRIEYGASDYNLQRCAAAEILYIRDSPIKRREILPEIRVKFPQLTHYDFNNAIQDISRRWKKAGVLLENENGDLAFNPEFREKNVWDHWSETH